MLIIFELANSHDGDIYKAIRMVDEFDAVAKKFPKFEYAFKTQYRSDDYFHPDCDPEDKYVKRFKQAQMKDEEWIRLVDYIHSRGHKAACTPFDEDSVDKVVEHGYDILKVGSPSFTDWQLWDKILASWGSPIIASCGGATEDEIMRVVKLCTWRNNLTLMHCVSEYPTKPENLQLNQIDWLKSAFPRIPIGFSSHEDAEAFGVGLATVKGATVIEMHVCLEPKPNKYSSNPDGMLVILNYMKMFLKRCGGEGRIPGPVPIQFQRRMIEGKPWWSPHIEDVRKLNNFTEIIKDIMSLIEKSGVVIPKGAKMVFSHHRGLEQFRKFGAAVIECFNLDEYSKKYLVMLPGQYHEVHKHKRKVETFHVVYGSLDLQIGASYFWMGAGDIQTVAKNTRHAFSTETGCVFEEIGTHSDPEDSWYDREMPTDRKTKVREW